MKKEKTTIDVKKLYPKKFNILLHIASIKENKFMQKDKSKKC
jgi:hypothetical protein